MFYFVNVFFTLECLMKLFREGINVSIVWLLDIYWSKMSTDNKNNPIF